MPHKNKNKTKAGIRVKRPVFKCELSGKRFPIGELGPSPTRHLTVTGDIFWYSWNLEGRCQGFCLTPSAMQTETTKKYPNPCSSNSCFQATHYISFTPCFSYLHVSSESLILCKYNHFVTANSCLSTFKTEYNCYFITLLRVCTMHSYIFPDFKQHFLQRRHASNSLLLCSIKQIRDSQSTVQRVKPT